MLLNEKIIIIRKMNNLTQEGFAEELGVSRQAVSKWENGTSVPDVQLLLRIADFYNLTLDQLVRDDFDLPISSLDEKKIANDLLYLIIDIIPTIAPYGLYMYKQKHVVNIYIIINQ